MGRGREVGKWGCGKVGRWEGRLGGWEGLFFQAAPAPRFFFKRLRLLIFFQAAPAPTFQGPKNAAPYGSGY